MPSKRLEENESPPVLRNEDTSQKDAQKSTSPTTTTPRGGALTRHQTYRSSESSRFPSLVCTRWWFTGGIETNLRRFPRVEEESLRSVPTHIEREKNSRNRRRIHSPFQKAATPRRGEAADVPPHRISQNSKTPASFSSGRCLRPPLLRHAIKINPAHHHLFIIIVAVDLTTSNRERATFTSDEKAKKKVQNSRAPSKCILSSKRRWNNFANDPHGYY